MTETKHAEYLGDGVYADYQKRGGYVVLTDEGNKIFLEPEVVIKLVNYLAALPGKIKEK